MIRDWSARTIRRVWVAAFALDAAFVLVGVLRTHAEVNWRHSPVPDTIPAVATIHTPAADSLRDSLRALARTVLADSGVQASIKSFGASLAHSERVMFVELALALLTAPLIALAITIWWRFARWVPSSKGEPNGAAA